MSKKIVIASFQQESNSFTAIHSTRRDFSISMDGEMEERIAVADYFREQGFEVIPTLYASAVPGGSVVYESFCSILEDILARIPEEPVDGVWLFLHGAMDVEHVGSGDLAIVKAVRGKVGSGVPIALAFDLHADVDEQLADYANVITGFRTAPHTDIEWTQLHAAELLVRCIREHYLPVPIIIKVPIIAGGDSMTTDISPGKDIVERVWKLEREGRSMCLDVFLGNPWVDTSCAGGAVVAIPLEGREKDAKEQAEELAELYWRSRGDFRFRARTADPEDGIAWALSCEKRPLFISDTGDNITGGGTGDSAELLGIFLEKHIEGAIFTGIVDGPLVEACRSLSPGDRLSCTLGGSLDPNSTKISVEAVYKRSGIILSWPAEEPVESVLISVDGTDVLVSAGRAPVIDLAAFQNFGIRAEDYRFVIVKLGYLWPALHDAAADSIMFFTSGSTCEVVERCNFKKIPRPMYPIDRDMARRPTGADGNV